MLGGGDKPKRADYPRPLVSWKAIAAYLGVTPRTAQEWEKERGLPVHREGNPQKPRIVAYPFELDRWGEQRRLTEIRSTPPLEDSRKGKPYRLSLLVLLFVLFFAAAVLWVTHDDPRLPVLCRTEGEFFKAFDERGDLLWAMHIPDLDAAWYAVNRPFEPYQIFDVDGDDRPEILYNAVFQTGSSSYGKLICFDATGVIRWEYRFGRVKKWEDRVFNDHYNGRLIRLVSSGDRNYLLVVANHNTGFPCQVSLLDAITGRLVSEYWHPGWLISFQACDLDDDGEMEILLGGTNGTDTDSFSSAALVAFKVPFSSSPKRNVEQEWAWGGGEMRYCVFPKADLHLIRNHATWVERLYVDSQDGIEARVTNQGDSAVHYRLDKNFRALAIVPDDSFLISHKQLWLEGLLDHDITPEELASLNEAYLYKTAPLPHRGQGLGTLKAGNNPRP
jgi:hypothetical protein